MNSLIKAIVAVVAALVVGQSAIGWGQGKDKPPVPPTEDPNLLWREYIRLPEDSFLVHGVARNEASWVKFIVVPQTDGSQQVFFQDGHAYPFHYQGAVANLSLFAGMTNDEFDRATLYRPGRKAVLGAVIVPSIWWSQTQSAEYGIQLVGHDPFTREEVAAIFDVVRQAVKTETPYRAFYLPTYEQRAVALADKDWFESQGITISSSDRWASGNTIYSNGWALGTLKFVEGGAIRDAYRSGRSAQAISCSPTACLRRRRIWRASSRCHPRRRTRTWRSWPRPTAFRSFIWPCPRTSVEHSRSSVVASACEPTTPMVGPPCG